MVGRKTYQFRLCVEKQPICSDVVDEHCIRVIEMAHFFLVRTWEGWEEVCRERGQ